MISSFLKKSKSIGEKKIHEEVQNKRLYGVEGYQFLTAFLLHNIIMQTGISNSVYHSVITVGVAYCLVRELFGRNYKTV